MFSARNPTERAALVRETVSVIGCGSVGSAVADMLVRTGLGRIVLVDPETLAIENVGRHILTARDVGLPKAVALAARLREINPELSVESRVEPFSDAEGLLASCVDSYRCQSMINAVSLARRLPAVFAGIYGAAHAGEIFCSRPGETACLECFAQFRKAQQPRIAAEKYTDSDFDETRAPAQEGLWPSILIVSGFVVHAILGMLGVRKIDLAKPLWIVNLDYPGFQPYAVTFARVAKGCPVCDESRVADLSV
jgi:molybdopterin/thiamine biosynthesis adenylyltransferase